MTIDARDEIPEKPESTVEEDAAEERDDEEEAPKRKRARKEKVLHTRVPAVLEAELKNLAESWRMPVSNLVRAILEDALEAMDTLGRAAEGEIRGVAARVAKERERLLQPIDRARQGFAAVRPPQRHEPPAAEKPPASTGWNRDVLDGAIGFTALVVANDTTCPVTGDVLPAGADAFLALFPDPSRNVVVSPRAVPGR
ncbi:MAG: hypothetical protein GXY23_16585 [Myxococcales bacterium]|nr:hypothetical protein [Myxococcales bacterium]